MKRLVLIAAVAAVLTACGSSGSTSDVLRPRRALLANLYFKVDGPSGLAKVVAPSWGNGAHMGGFVVASAAQGQKDCSQTINVNSMSLLPHSMDRFTGKKYTIAVYGNSSFAPAVCRALVTRGFAGGVLRDYRIPSSAMEPTLHCAKPAPGCLGTADDVAVARLNGAARVKRSDIIVFQAPREAAMKCGEGGTFVKRIVGLPGETVREDDHGFIWIRSAGAKKFSKLSEPYLSTVNRLDDSANFGKVWHVPQGQYFTMGDHRANSCDSRAWGSVPARDIVGPVLKIIRNGTALRQKQLGLGGGRS